MENLSKSLSEFGPGVAASNLGRALGGGLYEYKLEIPPDALLRLFFVVEQNYLVVILSAYDKKANDSKTWQNRQIMAARKLQKMLDLK